MYMHHYSDIQRLASGEYADVYRAKEVWAQRIVALKVFRNPIPDTKERFQREMTMLATHTENPFVIHLFGADSSFPPPYIALEYAELGSLEKYVARPPKWGRVAGWLADISCGLMMIHAKKNLVRNIKLSNLLRFMSPNGSERIKISDFGLRQKGDRPPGATTASPFGSEDHVDQVCKATENLGSALDIHSLGIAMRQLLTGSADLQNVVPGSPEFQALIALMTHSDPKRRPTARQVFHELQSIRKSDSGQLALDCGEEVS
jgi:eukaryotic-like serine/threonine-protein kinase